MTSPAGQSEPPVGEAERKDKQNDVHQVLAQRVLDVHLQKTQSAERSKLMEQITTKCAHCGATNNVFVQPDVEWMSRVRRMEREHAAMLEARRNIIALASGWDEHGAIGPREPLSWETVARMALDYARAAIDAAEQKGSA